MLILKVDGKTIDIKYNYRLYKNIVGDDQEKQDEKLDTFLSGLVNDDVDQVLRFGVAASQNKLTLEQVADQLDGQDVFGDIHKITTEILNGLCNSGFLALKVRNWMKYAKTMIGAIEKAYSESLKKSLTGMTKKEKEDYQSQTEETKVQLDTFKQQLSKMEERIVFPKSQD